MRGVHWRRLCWGFREKPWPVDFRSLFAYRGGMADGIRREELPEELTSSPQTGASVVSMPRPAGGAPAVEPEVLPVSDAEFFADTVNDCKFVIRAETSQGWKHVTVLRAPCDASYVANSLRSNLNAARWWPREWLEAHAGKVRWRAVKRSGTREVMSRSGTSKMDPPVKAAGAPSPVPEVLPGGGGVRDDSAMVAYLMRQIEELKAGQRAPAAAPVGGGALGEIVTLVTSLGPALPVLQAMGIFRPATTDALKDLLPFLQELPKRLDAFEDTLEEMFKTFVESRAAQAASPLSVPAVAGAAGDNMWAPIVAQVLAQLGPLLVQRMMSGGAAPVSPTSVAGGVPSGG